jgi:hypothetical protein
MSRGRHRITPGEKSMRAGPDSIHDAVRAILAQEIGVTVARENSRSSAKGRETSRIGIRRETLQFANRRLMVGEPHMLGPIFGRKFDGHPGSKR